MTRNNALLLVSALALLVGCGEDRPRHHGGEGEGEGEADSGVSPVEDQGTPWEGFCGLYFGESECDLVGSCRRVVHLRECYRTEQVGYEHVCRFENPEHYRDGQVCVTIAECVQAYTDYEGAASVPIHCDPDYVFIPPDVYPD